MNIKKRLKKRIISKSRNCRSGQVMILSIILLGGILISATAIAGLLVIYQIRQANDTVNSTKAFFAADAALEWKTYEYIKATTTILIFETPGLTFNATTSTDDGGYFVISSQGFSGQAVRALESLFY
ncbi:MAG: hypothetical protein QMD65_03365 [Patescibacteria group bacterium]|nr:hypothetical protein [Patescibacteria group bacterium]